MFLMYLSWTRQVEERTILELGTFSKMKDIASKVRDGMVDCDDEEEEPNGSKTPSMSRNTMHKLWCGSWEGAG